MKTKQPAYLRNDLKYFFNSPPDRHRIPLYTACISILNSSFPIPNACVPSSTGQEIGSIQASLWAFDKSALAKLAESRPALYCPHDSVKLSGSPGVKFWDLAAVKLYSALVRFIKIE